MKWQPQNTATQSYRHLIIQIHLRHNLRMYCRKTESWTLPITISEAVLGASCYEYTYGRNAGYTSNEFFRKQLRIRGKGVEGSDLIVELKIVIPKNIDEESQRLIEEFARRNPIVPNR